MYEAQQMKMMQGQGMDASGAMDGFKALKQVIGKEQVQAAQLTLNRYKEGKANLERRIVDNEQWYKLRHWECMRDKKEDVQPTSAWLFNCIANKHADAMDNFPSPNILPREEGDKAEAEMLTSIVPVILDQCEFEQTYSDVQNYKLKTGTGVYGVFWDKTKLNGIATSAIDAARATDIALETAECAVGMAVLADFAIPADNNYTLCSSADLKLMVIDGMAYTDGKADLSAGNYRAAFVFADPLTIPANAFKGIVELTVVHLPSYVHSIGEQTFADCAALGKVYCEGITPPAVEADSFEALDLATMTLYVHKVVESEYQNDAFWGTFGTINNF